MGRLWYLPSVLIALLMAVGAAGAYARLLSPGVGFSLFFLGIGIALLAALILAALSAFGAAWGKDWRPRAVRGALLPMGVVLLVVVPKACGGVHPINDITTDATDGLKFSPEVAALREEGPREALLELQHEVYPEVQPLLAPVPPDLAFSAARDAAHAMPAWEITTEEGATGRIEAVARVSLFHFEDDVVIRVQREGEGSRIDVRSRSRLGRSDFGANAARIIAYLDAVQRRLP
jgi:uncharacterized protein (DUF1499 family)